MLMKTDRELDSLFKSTFNEFSHEIPSEVFMDDLDSRLSRSKSKRTLGYWRWYLSGIVIFNDPSADYMVSNYRANKFSSVLQSGCLIEYLSTSGYKVMLNPTIRTSISNIVEDGLIKTAYSSFGLKLGVGYQ